MRRSTHYLKAAKASHSDDAATVNAAMRQLPVDRFGTEARLQANGRVVYDLGVYRVKAPAAEPLPLGLLREDRYRSRRRRRSAASADSGCAAAVQERSEGALTRRDGA